MPAVDFVGSQMALDRDLEGHRYLLSFGQLLIGSTPVSLDPYSNPHFPYGAEDKVSKFSGGEGSKMRNDLRRALWE